MIGYKLIPEQQWSDVNKKLLKLNSDITTATEFVREIERGNLDVSIAEASESELKTSLANMRDRMKAYSLTEKQRNWVNEGLAKFVQILRSTNNDARQSLSDNIIRNLVTYLKANQGALFALNEDDPKDIFLEQEACYAYDRKKFLEKRIPVGEGLAGQVVLEKSTLFMTDVPKDFIKITSGLGEALPRNILIVPLKLDEKIYGVVELASFLIFQPYEIEFVERLGESIAASIAAVKNNERTKVLLKETQLQAEQLKAQEEEVRQNLEELSATQEAMQRAMKEVETKEAYLSQILNTSQDIIYTVDRDYRMVMWNTTFAGEAERINVHLEKGMDAFSWSPEDRKKLLHLYDRVFSGETFEIEYESTLNGKKYCFLSVYAPIKSPTGEIIEAGIYARNVTAVVDAKNEAAQLLKESQQQSEELKAQEEELRQNMEELSATQEAMERAMRDVQDKEAYISQILNSSQDVIYTVDKEFRMVMWNSVFGAEADRLNLKIEKGMNAFEWSPTDREKLIPLYNRVFSGETFEIEYDVELGGQTYYFLSVYTPIKSPSGEIIEAGIYARNVTVTVQAKNESARLLNEAQQQAEELKAQEEELRQNMEELSATQEAMERAMKDVEWKEAYASQLLNASTDLIYTVDREFRFSTWNEAFGATVQFAGYHIAKGIEAFEWNPEFKAFVVSLYKRGFTGERFEVNSQTPVNDKMRYFVSLVTPLKNEKGEIFEVAVYSKDITALTEAQQESDRHLKEAQQHADQLKAREEELRQNIKVLAATQETIEIQSREVELRESYLSQLINLSQDVIFSVDQQYKLVTWNDAFAKTIAGLGIQPKRGMTAFEWRPDPEREHFAKLFKLVFAGETFEVQAESKFDGRAHVFLSTFAPLRNQNGEVVEAAVFARDVTGIVSSNQTSGNGSANGSSHVRKENGVQSNGSEKHIAIARKTTK